MVFSWDAGKRAQLPDRAARKPHGSGTLDEPEAGQPPRTACFRTMV
jgi:hypothetical protein